MIYEQYKLTVFPIKLSVYEHIIVKGDNYDLTLILRFKGILLGMKKSFDSLLYISVIISSSLATIRLKWAFIKLNCVRVFYIMRLGLTFIWFSNSYYYSFYRGSKAYSSHKVSFI